LLLLAEEDFVTSRRSTAFEATGEEKGNFLLIAEVDYGETGN